MSLKQISIEVINKNLSEDARQQLIGHIYVPHLENMVAVFYDSTDVEDPVNLLAEFEQEFPELVQPSEEDIDFSSANGRSFMFVVSKRLFGNIDRLYILKQEKCFMITPTISFQFERNNRLIRFCMERNLPIFAGIKRLVLPYSH